MSAKESEWFDSRKEAVAFTKNKSGSEKKTKYGWIIKSLNSYLFNGRIYKAIPRTQAKRVKEDSE